MSARRADSDAEKDKLARRVASYLLGDPDRGVEPLSISEITSIMKFKSRKSVYQYRDRAVEMGLLELDENQKPILPKKTPVGKFKIYAETNDLLKNPLMKYWWDKQCAKNGHKGTKIQFAMLNNLTSFFNTLKITPEELVYQKSNKVVEDYRDLYMRAYVANEHWKISKGSGGGDPKAKEYTMNQALNSFCNLNGIVWARGDKAMSRQVVGHGKYAKERFTKEEFEKADSYLKEKFGVDSDEFRWFWIGVETCSRAGALMIMDLAFEEVKNPDGTTKSLHLKTFESKLQHSKKGGDVEKFLRRKDSIESVKALRARGGTKIYENKEKRSKYALLDYFTQTMKDLYLFLGKSLDSYYFKKPNHTLRHLGAHYWLAKSNYRDFTIVAKIGDWSTVQEMIDSYGETPPEVFQETLDGYSYD